MSHIKPIARWARVPNEVLDGVQQVGLVAYHKDGIKEVQYTVTQGDTITSHVITETRGNRKTKIEEYSFDFDFNTLLPGDTITVSAKVIANDGSELIFDEPYSLEPKQGYTNLASYAEPLTVSKLGIHTLVLEKTYVGTVYKVELTGNNNNDGITAPFRTAEKAFSIAISGDVIQFGDGEFELVRPKTTRSVNGKSKWLTVRGSGKTVFTTKNNKESFSSTKHAVRWVNVTLDLGRVGYFSGKDMWWDNCNFINPSNEAWYNDGLAKNGAPDPSIPLSINGRQDIVFRCIGGEQFFTDCNLSNHCQGFGSTPLVRNSSIRKIWGDAFSKGCGIFNVNIDVFTGYLTPKHSDIYQAWDVMENVIMSGVNATNVDSVQGIFIRPVLAGKDWFIPNRPEFIPGVDKQCYFGNSAFVNNTFIHNPRPRPSRGIQNAGGAPFTQINNKIFHVLLINHKSPYQKALFGGDTLEGWEQRDMEDVILRDCDLHWDNIATFTATGRNAKWKPIEGGYEYDGVKAYGCYNSVPKS